MISAIKVRLTLTVLAALLSSAAAQAQTPSPLPEWYYAQGHLLEAHELPDGPKKWERFLGLSLETQPKYMGGNAYTTSGGPSFDFRYYDIAFASSGEGFGVNLLHTKTYRAGAALVYDLGRDQDDDHHLHGLGDISPAPEAKVFAEYLVFPVTFRIDGRYTFGGQGGWIGDISVYTPLAGNKKFFVFAGPSLTFADRVNQRHNFGISDKQALESGYRQYDVGSGLRSGSFGISAGYFFSRHWMVTGMAAGQQLFGGAGHSPLVQEQGQFVGTFTTAYRW